MFFHLCPKQIAKQVKSMFVISGMCVIKKTSCMVNVIWNTNVEVIKVCLVANSCGTLYPCSSVRTHAKALTTTVAKHAARVLSTSIIYRVCTTEAWIIEYMLMVRKQMWCILHYWCLNNSNVKCAVINFRGRVSLIVSLNVGQTCERAAAAAPQAEAPTDDWKQKKTWISQNSLDGSPTC